MKTIKTMVFLVMAATVFSGCAIRHAGEPGDSARGCRRVPGEQAVPSGK